MYKIYNGDFLEIMDRLIEDGAKVDCIITDPPYGINYRSNFKKVKFNKIQNDNMQQIEYIKKCSDLLNDGKAIYIFCRWDCFNEVIEEVKKHFNVKNCLVWYKKGGGLGDLKGSYIYNHEFIIFATKGRHILNGKRNFRVINQYPQYAGDKTFKPKEYQALITDQEDNFKMFVEFTHEEVKHYRDIKNLYKNNDLKDDDLVILCHFKILESFSDL